MTEEDFKLGYHFGEYWYWAKRPGGEERRILDCGCCYKVKYPNGLWVIKDYCEEHNPDNPPEIEGMINDES